MTQNALPLTLLKDGFADAVVVVVGGTGGIGVEVATQARDLGARVVVGSRSATRPDRLSCASGDVAEYPVDLTDTESARTFLEAIETAFGRIDILVNSAGITKQVPLDDLAALEDGIIDLVLASNTRGPLALIREAAPLLRKGRDPVIVNVSSVAAKTGIGSSIAYVGAKAAMDAVSVALAKSLAPAIRVVSVAPSALRTDFVAGRPERFFEKTIAATPLGRLASPAEVATAVICAARLLTATTGTTLYVDGGRHL